MALGRLVAAGIKAIDALIAGGKLDEAERALASRLRWSGGDGEARMKQARLLVKRGDNLGGARALHLVPFWWPARAEASFLEGQAFKRADRLRDAEAAWLACLAADPLHPTPSAMFHGAAKELVTLYILEGRIDEARATLWRAYEESTPQERPGVLATRVRAELERIDHQEAVERLLAAVEADPDDRAARRALALERHAIGEEAASDRDLDACLERWPDDAASWRARLEILNARGDVEAYHATLARLPGSADGDARIWMYRGARPPARRRPRGGQRGVPPRRRARAGRAEVLYKLGMAEVARGRPAAGREHLARSRELRQAYETLRDGYHDFLEQVRRAPRDEAGYRQAIEKLAATCRVLGFAREADAWLAQLTPG